MGRLDQARWSVRTMSRRRVGSERRVGYHARMPRRRFLGLVLVSIVLAPGLSQPARGGPVEDAIETRVQRLSQENDFAIGSARLAATAILPELYERREFRPAWSRPARVETLLRILDDAALDGLDPRDYHASELRRLHDGDDSAGAIADLDLLATDALVRLAYHLYLGKVDPERLDAHWNFPRILDREEAVTVLLRTLEEGGAAELIDRVRPRQSIYRDLRRQMAVHREALGHGGWPKVPAGPSIHAGMRDARVPALRSRLLASGDHPRTRTVAQRALPPDTSRMFDPDLERALRSFQRRHLLPEDGALGPATLAALNVPLRERIDQLRVNLERGRWVLHHLPDSFVVVNIAGYETFLVAGSRIRWKTRCQVGQAGRQTPIFRSDMKYLVFNPTWTVPPGILSKDILPSLQRGDLSVLKRKRLNVIDSQGRVVAPASVSWSRISARNCPYTFRQGAGPDNALGRVKFMFPNSYSVYLHDTPSQDLFEESKRAFSSGCIRVERPLELAQLLLTDSKWTDAEIERVIASGKTTTVNLKKPLPVLLLYWTAFPLADGQVAFAPDIYGRDPGVLGALDRELH